MNIIEKITNVQEQSTEAMQQIDREMPFKTTLKRESDFDNLGPKTPEDLVVEELNKKHAVVSLEQFYVLTEKENPIFGGIDFSLEGKQSFKNLYENKTVECSDKKTRTKADVWLKSPNRREYKGIVFHPTKSGSVDGYYNLWRGFSKKRQDGDCSKYWAHVRDNICCEDEESYWFVRKWLAFVFQHPDKVHTALVLCGSQGVGKNSFVEPLGVLLGTHYVLLSNITELVSNFNYHLKHAVLIHANEALWGGNRKEIGSLKAMITEQTCLIEGKGKDRIMLRNFKHVILSSNEDWPVHLDPDDRRFFVLRVSEKRKEDHEYFADLQQQLETGGYEALLHDLLSEDLTNFNPRRFPNNNEAFDIKLRSANTADKYIYNALQEGSFDIGNALPNEIWNECISTESVFEDYRSWCLRNGVKHSEKDVFSKRLRKLIPSIGDTKPTIYGKRVAKYTLPSLERARIEFEKTYKVDTNVWRR